MASDNVTYSGIGFFGLLTLLFIALKLIGVIDWSWWYVILPMFVPLLFIIGIFVVFLIGALITMIFTHFF